MIMMIQSDSDDTEDDNDVTSYDLKNMADSVMSIFITRI